MRDLTTKLTVAFERALFCDESSLDNDCVRFVTVDGIMARCLSRDVHVNAKAAKRLGELTEAALLRVVMPDIIERADWRVADADGDADGSDGGGALFRPTLLEPVVPETQREETRHMLAEKLARVGDTILDMLVDATVAARSSGSISVEDVDKCMPSYPGFVASILER